MRCLVSVSVLLSIVAAAPAPEGYGVPPPLTRAELEEAALDELEATEEALGPLRGGSFGGGIRGPGAFAGGYSGRLLGRDGLLGGRFGRPLGARPGLLDEPRVGYLANRALEGPGPLLGSSLFNQGNPPSLLPDGFVDGPSRPYSFDYEVLGPEFGNDYGHAEDSDGVVTQGEYHVLLPDGRTQIVTYSVEGDSGFQAVVRYEGEAQFAGPGSLDGPGPLGGLSGLGGPGRPGRLGGLGGLGPLGGFGGLGRRGPLGGLGGPGDASPDILGSQTYGAPLA